MLSRHVYMFIYQTYLEHCCKRSPVRFWFVNFSVNVFFDSSSLVWSLADLWFPNNVTRPLFPIGSKTPLVFHRGWKLKGKTAVIELTWLLESPFVKFFRRAESKHTFRALRFQTSFSLNPPQPLGWGTPLNYFNSVNGDL